MAADIIPISIAPQRAAQVRPSRYDVGLAVVLGAIFLVALAPRIDTDLWWHLKDGAFIWTHRSIPTRDFMSFTFAGHPWVDHEWMAELLLWGLYSLGAVWATIIFFAGVITLTFALVYIRIRDAGVNPMLALFVVLAAFISSSSTWGARPQMLTLLFLAVYGLGIERYLRAPNRRTLLLFPLLMLLWANSHGGWVLGLALLAVTCVGEWLNRRFERDGALSGPQLRDLAVTCLATFAVTVLTPNGLAGVLYPLAWIAPTEYSNVLTEWVSTDFHQPVFMVYAAMLLALMAGLTIGRPRLSWTHLLIIIAFTYLALSESRNVAVWAVVASPILALVLNHLLPAPSATPRAVRAGRQRILNLALLAMVAVVFPLEALHFVTAQALRADEVATYPVGALAYMDHHQLPSNTFNAYAWGGYLLWAGYPRYRDFIDGRANTLFDDRILNDYLTASSAAPGWEAVLNRHAVGTVLIPPSSPLAQVLAESKGWRLAYHDPTAVVYTRRKEHL